MPYNIPLNPTSGAQFSGWRTQAMKLPAISGIGEVYEVPAGWGTAVGLIAGRAKGYAGVGTVAKDSSATVWLPETFEHTPILQISVIAPNGFDMFDRMDYSYKDAGVRWFDTARLVLLPSDKREQIYAEQRFVHRLRDRRHVPLSVSVFTTNNGFAIQHGRNIYSAYLNDPMGNDEYCPPGEFDGAAHEAVYVWHAFGV